MITEHCNERSKFLKGIFTHDLILVNPDKTNDRNISELVPVDSNRLERKKRGEQRAVISLEWIF